MQLLDHKGITFVTLGNNVIGQPLGQGHDMVFSDDVQGAYDVTRHLIGLGHRHIGFVGNTQLPWFFRCHTGYARAMREAGLKSRECNIRSDNDAEIGYLGQRRCWQAPIRSALSLPATTPALMAFTRPFAIAASRFPTTSA